MQRRHFLFGSLASVCALLEAQKRSGSDHSALIPYPKTIQWTGESLGLGAFEMEAPSEAAFAAAELRKLLTEAGGHQSSGGVKFVARLGAVDGASAVGAPEAYSLDVARKGVILTAPKPAGLLFGVQTLRQLLLRESGQTKLPGCRIVDWPSYAWRGFLVDVSRNFQDLPRLTKFVDVLAQYKMNVFHFHLADDEGYRIECRVHPEVNAPKSYAPLRDPGRFYTYSELNGFFQYCAQRNIMVVPEIDMPGHSNYLPRALGVDMQDEKGMKIMEDILNEFMDNIDTKFLHVGSDEVEVRNPKFMDHMSSLIRRRGRQVVAWHPGNPPAEKYVSQVWTYGPALETRPGIPVVDSRNNYINHADPFLAPLRLMNFATAGKQQGDDMAWGGTLCLWPDIRNATVENIYRLNPVYSSLLAASENYWHGGTEHHPEYWGHLPPLNDPAHARFVQFENRLIEHRDRFFANAPFPYVRQSDIVWKLIGPFDHRGDLAAAFDPEKEIRDSYDVGGKTFRWIDAVGATIVINQPNYEGWFPRTPAGTVYGLTYVWAPRAGAVDFWIGFNGPSRSNRHGAPNPQQGEWSTAGSKIWVNDAPIAPPVWQQPGPLPDMVETPLVDEDYFYRKPTSIPLKAGWNKILIKVPKLEKHWTWVYTCVPVHMEGAHPHEVEGLRFSVDRKK